MKRRFTIDVYNVSWIILWAFVSVIVGYFLLIIVASQDLCCREYVINYVGEERGVGITMSSIIDYDELPHYYRKRITEEEWNDTSDEGKLHLARVVSDIPLPSHMPPMTHSTDENRYPEYTRNITVDDTKYLISYTLYFSPWSISGYSVEGISACVYDYGAVSSQYPQ